MARKPKETQTAETKTLVEAIEFANVAQVEDGERIFETHIIVANMTAVGFDGVLSAGVFTGFGEINACPNSKMFLAALKKCKTTYTITQTSANTLLVKSGEFRAVIPCVDHALMTFANPDNAIAPIDDRIKEGFKVLNPLVKDAGDLIVPSTILLRANSMVATDRQIITEYWHGIDLPPNLIIPKRFINAIIKCPKKLSGFGYSDKTITFWFEDNSWIKTQLYSEGWPNTDAIFNSTPAVKTVPTKLAGVLSDLTPFCVDGVAYFHDKMIASNLDNSIGATHDCAGITAGPIVPVKRTQLALGFATGVDWDYGGGNDRAYFQGNGVRCVMMYQRANPN